jgi:hypothetical protein
MKFIALLIIFSLLILPLVLADVVEITIEYGDEGCTESWSCSEWSDCVDNMQTRACTDSNNCGTTVNKPAESQSCSEEENPPGGSPSGSSQTSGTTSGGITGGGTTISEPEEEDIIEPNIKESNIVSVRLDAPDELESGEPFTAEVTITSSILLQTDVTLLNKKQPVSVGAGETKIIYFDVYAPEKAGNYNLVADALYATGNKTIFLEYKPLFLYTKDFGNNTYQIHLKNFDNSSAVEITVIKDDTSTVYFDYLNGKVDYKTNLTLTTGEYRVLARLVSDNVLVDEDQRMISVVGEDNGDWGSMFLIAVVLILIAAFYLALRR